MTSSLAKWQPAKAFFICGKKGPGLANKVDGGKFNSAIVNCCHGKPRRCELVHCLGGRGFLLWASLAFFLWLLPLDAWVVQNNGVQSLCSPFEGIQSVWYPGNLVFLILKTFHTPLVNGIFTEHQVLCCYNIHHFKTECCNFGIILFSDHFIFILYLRLQYNCKSYIMSFRCLVFSSLRSQHGHLSCHIQSPVIRNAWCVWVVVVTEQTKTL